MLSLWFNRRMKKSKAIKLLGGTTRSAAEALGVTFQAVSKWPDPLPQRISDRVLGAHARAKEKSDREKTAAYSMKAGT